MKRLPLVGSLVLIIGSVSLALADGKPAEDRTNLVTRAAVEYLSQEQQPAGSWNIGNPTYEDGVTALSTIALLRGGVDVKDERIQRSLKWLREAKPAMTYSRALHTVAFCQANLPADAELIRDNVKWLADAQSKDGPGKGGWSYGVMPAGRGDGSCSRFSIWALDSARKINVAVPGTVWKSNADYWLKSQLADGSWGYMPSSETGTVTMTLSGIYCLAAIKDALPDPSLHERINQAVEKAWGRHDQWCTDSQPAYLKTHGFRHYTYQLLAGTSNRAARPLIANNPWKRIATSWLIDEQQNGQWRGKADSGFDHSVINTGLSVLFLTEK